MTEDQNLNTEQSNQQLEMPQQEPKIMQQHEINALVGGAKQKGYEKGKNEGYQLAKAELMSQQQVPNLQTNPQSIPMTDDERLRQIALEELSKQRAVDQANYEAQVRQEQGTRILNELKAKASAAKSKIEDFNKVVREDFQNFAKTPEVLALANNFDNAGEMLYDMAKNPGKIAQITWMADRQMYDEAYLEMKKLSDSIKLNEMSANQPKPKMPLSQIQPSTVGVGKVDEDSYSRQFRGSY